MAAGVGRNGIAGRLKRGQLHPLLSDVYLYGPRGDGDRLTMAMAVVLHLRGDAVISSAWATWIWELTDQLPDQVIATLVGRSTTAIPGVKLHRAAAMHPTDVRWRKGIPLTSPARSLVDFAGSGASLPRVESALATLRRTDAAADRQILETLERLPANHRGAALIRKLIPLPPGELALTKSVYERRLRRLLQQARLPLPLSNVVVAGRERDLVWPHAKLIVEFDGWIVHRDRFREDRKRDAQAAALGWRVIRLTADRVDNEPFAVIAELSAALLAAAEAIANK
jgi:very-short-patch-repair endonuclease